MPSHLPNSLLIARARELRIRQTKSEGLLWSILRANQVCGLKFRRQHPIGPYIVDFASVNRRLVVEIDGGYHDRIGDKDLRRQAYLIREGWRIIRFTDEDVEANPESVARAIASTLGLAFDFNRRKGSGSGMKTVKCPRRNQIQEPSRPRPKIEPFKESRPSPEGG